MVPRQWIEFMRFFGNNLTCIRGERVVFANLDFSVSSGEAITLVGRNGSGKTSLLRVMAGLTRMSHGILGWNDGSVSDDPERHRRRLNFVGHLDSVKPVLTVRENLAGWARLRHATDEKVSEGLVTFGLGGLADIPGRYLSTGQRRRLSLARLCLSEAPLWLLDEPTIALDSEAVTALDRAIVTHRDGGGMVIIATNVALSMDDAVPIDMGDFAAAAEDTLQWV
jgi:heme exporter protein A